MTVTKLKLVQWQNLKLFDALDFEFLCRIVDSNTFQAGCEEKNKKNIKAWKQVKGLIGNII